MDAESGPAGRLTGEEDGEKAARTRARQGKAVPAEPPGCQVSLVPLVGRARRIRRRRLASEWEGGGCIGAPAGGWSELPPKFRPRPGGVRRPIAGLGSPPAAGCPLRGASRERSVAPTIVLELPLFALFSNHWPPGPGRRPPGPGPVRLAQVQPSSTCQHSTSIGQQGASGRCRRDWTELSEETRLLAGPAQFLAGAAAKADAARMPRWQPLLAATRSNSPSVVLLSPTHRLVMHRLCVPRERWFSHGQFLVCTGLRPLVRLMVRPPVHQW